MQISCCLHQLLPLPPFGQQCLLLQVSLLCLALPAGSSPLCLSGCIHCGLPMYIHTSDTQKLSHSLTHSQSTMHTCSNAVKSALFLHGCCTYIVLTIVIIRFHSSCLFTGRAAAPFCVGRAPAPVHKKRRGAPKQAQFFGSHPTTEVNHCVCSAAFQKNLA